MRNYKICSGSFLKIVAIISMLVDHTAVHLLRSYSWAMQPWFAVGRHGMNLFLLLRMFIGRLAFPIFAFLLVEGYMHTRNKKRYAMTLFGFAVITEPIWDLIHFNCLFSVNSQNVLFTLLLGLIGMWLYDWYKNNFIKRALSLVVVFAIAYFLHSDYGVSGVAFVLLLYLFREKRECQFVAAVANFCHSIYSATAVLAMIPISLYSGKRGFIKGNIGKYCFYLFYPLHLLILYWLK